MADAFKQIRAIGRKPIVAQIGGARPEEGINSWFGGHFLAPEGLQWPSDGDGPLAPLLQICVPEVPGGEAIFKESHLVQVFLNGKNLPHRPAPNGEGWLLREFPSVEDLVTVPAPAPARLCREFQVRWRMADRPDYPCWEEAWDYADMSAINDSEELSEQYHERFQQYEKTKIGGFASYIQSPCAYPYQYIFQISSEEKPRFMVGDGGNLYILRDQDTGQWYLQWDCY